MNANMIKGKWQQIKEDLRKAWGRMKDDQWGAKHAETRAVSGLVQNKYGQSRYEVSRKLSEPYERHTETSKPDADTNVHVHKSVESTQENAQFINQLRRDHYSNEKRTTEF